MLKKLACLLALIASPLFAQQTPQAIPLTSGACKLDGTVGCGAGGGGGSGTVTSVAISGGTTGFSFSGSPITTSGTFTLSGTLAIANGGTNLTTYTLGDTLYASAANTLAKLAGNTTTTKKFLMQVGDGVNSAAPTWTATAADFPTLNQNTTGNAATATALAADPGNCLSGNAPLGISANGDAEGCFAVVTNLTGPVTSVGNATAIADGAIALSKLANGTAGNVVTYSAAGAIAVTSTGTAGQVLTSNGAGAAPTFQAAASAGANTALSNLASVAINADLATGAGTAANLTATPPAAITTAQAGIASTVKASDAVAGSSVAGAASGGLLTLQAGDSKRLTSGNADALGVRVNTGAGIGTGAPGWLNVWFGGPSVTTAKQRWQGDSVSIVLNGAADWSLSGTQRATIFGIGSGSYAGAPTDATLIGYRIGVAGSETGAVRVGNNIHSGSASNDTGGLSATTSQSSNSVQVGFDSGVAAAAARSVAIGYRARVNAADTGVVGGIGFLSWQIGSASNTPVTRTFRSPSSRGGTDSNVAGSSLNIAAGEGTGTAGGGSVRIQTAPAGSTGTTANTLSDRRVFAAKQVTLTESTATLVLNVGVASGTVAGGVFSYTIRADDGTDFQVIRGDVPWSAVNKAGTITATLGTPIEVTTTSTGTLTNTTTAVVNGNTIDFKLNAVSSLTQTTLHAYVSGTLDGTGVFTTQ